MDEDGFSIVEFPQFSELDVFDRNALNTLVGIRAIWRLYKQGRWEDLEDLGVIRSIAQPKADRLGYKEHLSYVQSKRVKRLIPEFAEASRELRLAYALLYVKDDMKKIYHAEVPAESSLESRQKAVALAEKFRGAIEKAGGTIEAGRRFHESEGHSMLMITLKSGKPETFIPDLEWKEVKQGETIEIPADALGPNETIEVEDNDEE